MARGAIADVLRKYDGGEVRPGAAVPDPVRRAGNDAGQARSAVDLVDQNLHVLSEPGVRIDGLGRVAHDAQFHFDARSAVPVQRVVALVAGIGRDDRAGGLYRVAVGNEGENVVRDLAPFVELSVLGQVAEGRDSDGVRDGAVEGGWGLGLESIGVVA